MIFRNETFNFREFLLEEGFSVSMRSSNVEIYRRDSLIVQITNESGSECVDIFWESCKVASLNFIPTLKLFSEMLIWESGNYGCMIRNAIIEN